MRMRLIGLGFGLLLGGSSFGQEFYGAYNRDTGETFKIKRMESWSNVTGPIATTRTIITMDNPYKKLTEASFNFALTPGSALKGFAYWYKNEYVPGILMDKRLAWFIYEAITSRDRDPGIMDQVTPTSFHAQIYPLAVGYDLRIELTSLSFLAPEDDRWRIAEPTLGDPTRAGFPEKIWHVAASDGVVVKDDKGRAVSRPRSYVPLNQVRHEAIVERFKDGKVYVAGVVTMPKGFELPSLKGLTDVRIVETESFSSESVYQFTGILNGPGYAFGSEWTIVGRPTMGSNAAQLWAQARLTDWPNDQDVLAFSLKYQVPSAKTALLAVPKEEMKLFEKKKQEFLAKLRRENARMRREGRKWDDESGRVNQNRSSGGDPEVRIHLPSAETASLHLPDGRVLPMRSQSGGWWTINFEIPPDAPEGEYKVEVVWRSRTGIESRKAITYTVDRTPPKFTSELKSGRLIVHSEPDLAEASLHVSSSRIIQLKEVAPGVYEAPLPEGVKAGRLYLKDRASNKEIATWSRP